tara:strand:+ start:438 stop:1766 length:1329 start_codon:yes stop_codon:yes gene_type:complete
LLKFIKKNSGTFTRIKNNLLSHVFKLSSETVIQIFLPFFLISSWGADLFGKWIILNASSIIVCLFLFKFSHAIQQKMTSKLVENKIKELNILNSNHNLLIALNISFFLIIFLISSVLITLNELKLFNIFGKGFDENNFVLIILTASSVLKYFISSYYHTRFNFRGELSYPVYIRNLLNLFLKFSIIIFSFFTKDLVLISFLFIFFDFIELIIFNINTKKQNNLIHQNKLISKKKIKEIIYKSVPNNIEIFNSNLHAQLIIFILGTIFSNSVIALIATAKTLFYYFPYKIFNTFNTVFYFEIAKLFYAKNYLKLKKIINFQILSVIIYLSLFIFFSVILGKYIYKIWIPDINISIKLIILLIISSSLIIFTELLRTFSKSINNYLRNSVIEFFLSIFCISLSFLFIINFKDYLIYFYFLIAQYTIMLIIEILWFKHNLNLIKK